MPRYIKGRSFYDKSWYASYHSMMDRCYRAKAKNYPLYGGRGICVCEEWHDIENFEKWVCESGYAKGLTLDRIDSNGDYSPSNCRWATRKEQANNKRNTHYLTYNGQTKTISDWAEEIGVNRSTINNRYFKGLPIEMILSKEPLNSWEIRRMREYALH